MIYSLCYVSKYDGNYNLKISIRLNADVSHGILDLILDIVLFEFITLNTNENWNESSVGFSTRLRRYSSFKFESIHSVSMNTIGSVETLLLKIVSLLL